MGENDEAFIKLFVASHCANQREDKMMRVITFDCHGHNAPAYGCSEPGDQSGEYIRAPEWVKCSERLPDVLGQYWCLMVESGEYYTEERTFNPDKQQYWGTCVNVEAWWSMPLPQPPEDAE